MVTADDDTLARRSRLVVTIDQREALEAACEQPRAIPTERQSPLRLLGVVLVEAFPDPVGTPHAIAGILAKELERTDEGLIQ